MKKKLLIILGVLIVLYLIGKGCSNGTTVPNQSTSTDSTTQEPSKDKTITLPENKFDTTVAAPGTNLIFSYPSKGFYELGARVTTYQPGDPNGYGNVLTIQPEQTYNAEKGSEFVSLVVALRNANIGEKTLRDVVAGFNPNSIEAEYVKKNGKYETANGREFFLYKVEEDLIIWRATTLQNNQVITVTMMYKLAGGAESKAAFQYNNTLFSDIIKNISSK